MFLGKKTSVIEKPIVPAELPEPVLMGSLAIGCTSLAIAKSAATVRDIPLYLYIALLKHDQVLVRIYLVQIQNAQLKWEQRDDCHIHKAKSHDMYRETT